MLLKVGGAWQKEMSRLQTSEFEDEDAQTDSKVNVISPGFRSVDIEFYSGHGSPCA